MNLVQINSQQVQIKEYQGRRVVTSSDIALVHNKETKHVNEIFKTNQKHFILGEDYFIIPRDICKVGQNDFEKFLTSPRQKELYLFTEQGYLMLVKSFTDDLAWRVQRELVNSYFKVKQQQQLTQLDLFNQMVNTFNEQQQKIILLESKVDYLNTTITVNDNQTLRQKLHSTVASWSYKNQKPVGVGYNTLYGLINRNLHMNIKSRATRRKLKPIDVLEELNLFEYALRILGEVA